VVVNIPAAVAEAVEDDMVQHRYVVVVGKTDRPSPTLTTSITAINLNPTWTAPLSIVKKDIVPKMRKDPGYVSRMKMRLLDGQGNEIDPRSVDWSSDRSPNFTVRQDSGAGNALGAIRIDMPNPHAVYMHDTNTKNLFRADYRFHSSGCARVAEVRDLAAWLLSDNGGWGRRELDAAIATGQRQDIRLKNRVPVAWVYFTGWVTRDDVVHFRDDIYGHDAPSMRTQVSQLSRPPVQTAARASGFVLQSADTRPVLRHVPYLDER
jgi:murein L,D-transpeptidase YcbB/YkuD